MQITYQHLVLLTDESPDVVRYWSVQIVVHLALEDVQGERKIGNEIRILHHFGHLLLLQVTVLLQQQQSRAVKAIVKLQEQTIT